jgi:hypothetical protein
MPLEVKRRSGPAVALALELAPEQRPRPFVLDDEHAHRPRHRDPEPVLAGGQVAGQVDRQRRFVDAAVAVDHRVAALGDQRTVGRAEDRS